MKTRSVPETAIICVTSLIALAIVAFTIHNADPSGGSSKPFIWLSLVGLAGLGIFVFSRHLTASRTASRELTSGEEYRQLADEYRRLADLAITAQEHTDLKLGDVSVRIDYLREQLDSMQRILKEVE